MQRLAVAGLAIALAACGSSTDVGVTQGRAAEPTIANGCFALDGAEAWTFHWKPSGPGTYLPYDADGMLLSARDGQAVGRDDAPGPRTEWSLIPQGSDAFQVASTHTGRRLVVQPSGDFAQADTGDAFGLVAAAGCRMFPEAGINATGTPFSGTNPDGTVAGFADLHVHVTASLRAGGQVISGEPFHRYGITHALGRDADVHGPDGALDVTGNLLRTGLPVGTHDTRGWPTFTGWPVFDTNTHQQVYYVWLQRAWMAGQRLIVAMTVEDEPLCRLEPLRSHSCDEGATIALEVAQLRALQDYVDAQHGGAGRGWFRLVFDPRDARRVIEQGRLAVVIGAESSNLFGCSEFLDQPQCTRADIDRGVADLHALGIRTVFPMHWVDNAFGGAALEGGDKGTFISTFQLMQTGHPFRTGPCPEAGQGEELPGLPGRRCNQKGLTDLGEYLVGRLMDAGVLIEMDHMSEFARRRVLEIAEARGYPLVSSHTHTGGTWTASELARLYAVGGIASARADQGPAFAEDVLALETYRDDRFFFGVPLSTDTGGFAALPAPRGGEPLPYPFLSFRGDVVFDRQHSGERTFDLNADGVAHYGLVADLLADAARQGDPRALELLFRSAEAYLQMWERAAPR